MYQVESEMPHCLLSGDSGLLCESMVVALLYQGNAYCLVYIVLYISKTIPLVYSLFVPYPTLCLVHEISAQDQIPKGYTEGSCWQNCGL